MRTCALPGLLCLALAASAAEPMEPGDVLLTVYSPRVRTDTWGDARREELAVVRECRRIPLPAGTSEYRFADVSGDIDPTTVRLVDLTDPGGTRVLEQSYHFDLVGRQSLLTRFLGRPVEFVDARGRTHAGKLVSGEGEVILAGRRGAIEILGYGTGPYTLRLSEAPDDLVTRPTLLWTVHAAEGGEHDVVVSYQTGGLSWRSDYSAILAPDESRLDLSGWVTLSNTCGTRFAKARVKLFAGDVRRVDTEAEGRSRGVGDEPEAEERWLAGHQRFFEYHLFALQRPITLANRQTKQVRLLAASDIPVEKVYTYDGARRDRRAGRWHRRDETYGTQCRATVRVNLEFENRKAAGLGLPLPAGVVRGYQRDPADGALEFIGEDRIGHTPRGERVRLYFGDAFDLVGRRLQTAFEHPERNQTRETFEIQLRNHKPTDVTVRVLEHLYRWVNWEIEESSLPSEKLDSDSVEFALSVPANGQATLTYTVVYWWE
ncbi:MAG: DUF4139 domain-containing protein [bacterium]